MSEHFDFEAALKATQSGKAITGKRGVLAPLVKQPTEAALETKLDSHLANDVAGKVGNGKSKGTVQRACGEFELETPCERTGRVEPKVVKKGVSDILCVSRVSHSVTTNRSSKCIANCGFA